jgi:hypothetical protein
MPRLKMEMATHALARNRERYAGKLTDDQILALTARQANAAFGGLNYKLMGRNKTFQDALRLFLMAPDFLEARARFVAQGARPYGREQSMALLLGAVVLYTLCRLLNEAINGDPQWDTPFAVIINGKEYKLRTVQEDLVNAIEDPAKFAKNRLSPPAGAVVDAMGGEKHNRKKDETLTERAKAAAASAVPIPVQPFVQKGSEDKTLTEKAGESALKMAGVNVKKHKKGKK